MNTKRNKTKTLILVGLLLAVAGLTLGFAAFSNTLTIKSSATVTPDASTFSVQFSASETEILVGEENPISPSLKLGDTRDLNTDAIIDAENPTTITNLSMTRKQYGSVSYDIYVHNTGEYDAYLNEIIFYNVDGKDSNIVCTAIENAENSEVEANQDLVNLACESVSIRVSISGNETAGSTGNLTETTKVSGHKLPKGEVEILKIVLMLSKTSTPADGPFTVEFGDVELVYSSADVNAETSE